MTEKGSDKFAYSSGQVHWKLKFIGSDRDESECGQKEEG